MSYDTVPPNPFKVPPKCFSSFPILHLASLKLVCFFRAHHFPSWFDSLDLGDVASGHRIETVFTVTKIKVTQAINQEKSIGVREEFPAILHKQDTRFKSCC